MAHVIPEQTTVYRCVATNRRYLSKWAAYYNAAKALIRERYPDPDYVVRSDSSGHDVVMAQDDDPSRDWERIDRRRRALFFDDGMPGGYEEEECAPAFDSGRWSAFVRRLAKFLRFVDARSAQ